MLTSELVRSVVQRALAEDVPWGDITVELTIPQDAEIRTRLVAREAGVFAGGAFVTEPFRQVDGRISVANVADDGARFEHGDVLAEIAGPARGILTAERTALNIVQRMSGIATLTSQFVDAVSHTSARIADTRKTSPGLRALEKHAVVAGGGTNHRFSLSDAVMIKDNHLAALGAIDAESTTAALRGLRQRAGHTTSIVVEVDRLEQIAPVLEAGVTVVLLDNFAVADLATAVRMIEGRAISEASGGVRLDTVAAIAETGVDVVSVGQLTHGAPALDLGLDAA